ncbi:unnamed protein product, partial [Discosporangium mesarthrocarpum]
MTYVQNWEFPVHVSGPGTYSTLTRGRAMQIGMFELSSRRHGGLGHYSSEIEIAEVFPDIAIERERRLVLEALEFAFTTGACPVLMLNVVGGDMRRSLQASASPVYDKPSVPYEGYSFLVEVDGEMTWAFVHGAVMFFCMSPWKLPVLGYKVDLDATDLGFNPRSFNVYSLELL